MMLARRAALCGASAAVLAACLTLSGPARAADADAAAPAASDAVGEVVVTGQTLATQKAIATKKQADVVSDSIASSEIGQLPEFGLGEALQRIPGVSFVINNGRGEAQFETIRGLNPDYNSVTLDGMVLPSTEETRRQVSFDVLPSILANSVTVTKTYTADLPSDATGGVTDLKTHSAFDHPGPFIAGHLDGAYWEQGRKFHDNLPSGQGDVRVSDTFGPDGHFGALLLLSYYQRSSNSLNSYSLPYSYYNGSGPSTPLTPTTGVAGLTPIPDRRRWYFYDNLRQRPGAFGKLEYQDNSHWRAHFSVGAFEHTNDENRYSQYLNRGPATATFTGPTTATFATGTAETDYDKYNQYREILFYDFGVGYDFDPHTKLDLAFNYAHAFYRQNTTEMVFTSPTNANFGFTDVGQVKDAQLFIPNSVSAWLNPASYNQTYYLTAVDKSDTNVPQLRVDFSHTPDGDGLMYKAGYGHRETQQTYFYHEQRLNPVGTAPTLATAAPNTLSLTPFDSGGLPLMFLNPDTVTGFVAGNPQLYAAASTNLARSTANNFALTETIDGGYAEAGYRTGPFFALAGLRYEHTREEVTNYQPSPITSTTNYASVNTSSFYDKLLPSLNLSYDITPDLKARAAVSRTLARPTYSQLAQNSSLTFSGTTATEAIANPNLKPRESNNYDLSLEWYPQAGTSLSVAGFHKDISHEIFTLTTTVQNTTVPGLPGNNYTVITSTPANAGSAKVDGVEFGIVKSRMEFLPGPLKGFGFSANATLISMTAPSIQMSDKVTYRRLPQLLESSKDIENVSLFYNAGPWGGEIAYNHTGKMPISFDTTNAVNDQWWAATDTVDAQLNYRPIKGVELRLQVKNMFDDKNQKVVGPNQNLNYSLLDNGRAYYVGVGFAF